MKTCPHCGTKNFDTDVKCGKCSFPLRASPFKTVVEIPSQDIQPQNPQFYVKFNRPSSLQLVARVFMIISCVASGIAALSTFISWIISLFTLGDFAVALCMSLIFWVVIFVVTICMTNNYCYKIASGTKIGITFKIITLIFISLIAGILMLCDRDSNQ